MYLIPIEDVATQRSGILRVNPPRNGSTKTSAAAQYEVAKIDVY